MVFKLTPDLENGTQVDFDRETSNNLRKLKHFSSFLE